MDQGRLTAKRSARPTRGPPVLQTLAKAAYAGPHPKRPPAMKIRHILLATTCTAALALGGCASNPSGAQVGTGVGAVVGGVAGNAVFGGPVGAIGGAAAGALIGHEIGEDRDQRKPYRR